MVSMNHPDLLAVDLSRVPAPAYSGSAVNVFSPVFPPDRNAADLLGWLQARSPRTSAARPS